MQWKKLWCKTLCDTKIRQLTAAERWVFVGLILAANSDGSVEYFANSALASLLGVSRKLLKRAINKLEALSILKIEGSYIYIKNYLRYQAVPAYYYQPATTKQ